MSAELEIEVGIEVPEVEVEIEVEAEVEVEVELEVEAEVEIEVEVEVPEVEIEVEIECPEVEIEVEVEVPEVAFEVEVEIECPEVEIEVEIECPEVEIEVEIEVPDVELGMNVEVDLNAPLTVELEVGGGVADSKIAAMGAAKMGGMTQFCAFLAWFTFMVGIVVCSLFSVMAKTGKDTAWLGWICFAIMLAASFGGIIFCFCSAGKRSTADIRAEVNVSA